MDNIIVIGSTAYLYSYVQRNGVTPLVAFGLFTIILPYVAQKLLVAPPLSGNCADREHFLLSDDLRARALCVRSQGPVESCIPSVWTGVD